MPSVEERLATLEADNDNMTEKLDRIEKKQDILHSYVSEIKNGMSKQKGFIAGIMFVVTPLWAAIVMYAKAFWDRFIQ